MGRVTLEEVHEVYILSSLQGLPHLHRLGVKGKKAGFILTKSGENNLVTVHLDGYGVPISERNSGDLLDGAGLEVDEYGHGVAGGVWVGARKFQNAYVCSHEVVADVFGVVE